ncbi:MAG: ribosome biogenesis factor YjgA [Sedimenticola sp.]
MNEESIHEDEFEEDDLVSRAQLKREMQALQELGARLMKLKPEIWQQFNFSESMFDALNESRRIKNHNAIRRHVRRLGKLLKDEDTQQVTELFARMDNEHLQDTQRFHRIERWRDRLIAEGDTALNELLDSCPNVDRQHIRQLVRTAAKESLQGKSPAAQRKLFKYLKQLDLK